MKNINTDQFLINQLFDAQPFCVLWMKPVYTGDQNEDKKITDFKICYYNKVAAAILNISEYEALGNYFLKNSFLDAKAGQNAFEQCLNVFLNNTSKEYTIFNPILNKHFNIIRSRVNDGVLTIARDITAQIIAEKRLNKQSDFLNRILDASVNAVFVCKAIRDADGKINDLQIIKINHAFTELIGKTHTEVEGKTYLSLFPSAKDAGMFALNCKVITSGISIRKEVYYKGDNLDAWYDISLVKLGENSLLVSFSDISEAKQALLQTERQKALLDNILKHSPSGIAVVELIRDLNNRIVDGLAIVANNAAKEITGIKQQIIKNKISEIDSKILTNPLFQIALSIVQTGKPFLTQYFLKSSRKWLELGISKIDDDNVVIVFTDITSSKTTQIEVQKSADQLLSFINNAHSGMAHMIPVKNNNGEVIDFRFNITNASFAAYVNEQPLTIKQEPVSKYFPAYKENGLFDQYKYTYNKGDASRFEIYYEGDGVDAWFDIRCTKMEDGILVTLTDMTTIKRLQIDLENLVNELKKSNASLQEFAYVASHDLQEPLRKIQVFAERLKKDVGDELSEENQKVFERMIAATERMSQLINDLLAYSQLTTKPADFKLIDLKDLIGQVLTDLEATVAEKNGTVVIGDLPAVKGDPMQLRQLFQNLVSNSVKYSKKNIHPVIYINSEIEAKEVNGLITSFNSIKISDNGIGFEQQYVDRIFKVFQRLHGRSEYPGTGIGLAIVQKVVENHNGYISAESEPEKGAVFKVYLPV